MSIPALFPGQDYIAKEKDEQGREVLVYAYRSRDGKFFSCTGETENEVREKCIDPAIKPTAPQAAFAWGVLPF